MQSSCLPPLSRALGAVLVVAALAAATPALAGVLTATDASWKVTATAPAGSGWQNSATFDDTAWEAATELYNVSTYLGPTYTARGIWSSAGEFSRTDLQIWARQVVTVVDDLASAVLRAGFDDDADVWVNGQLVYQDNNGSAGNSGPIDITAFLSKGANVIAYTARDNWPVWGFQHSSWLQVDTTVATASVPEPTTLALLALGLAGMAGLRRRPR